MASINDKLTILLVLVSVIPVFGDSDLHNYAMDSDSGIDVSLEDRDSNHTTDVEINPNEGQSIIDSVHAMRDAIEDYDADNATTEATAANQAVDTTTAAAEEIPEALGLKNVDYEYSQPNKNIDDKMDAADAEVGDLTEAAPATADGVYKTKDIVPEDVYSSNSGRDDAIETSTITKSTEVLETLASSGEVDQLEAPGQRIAKTENTEAKQPIDKRNNDAKPRSTPIASRSSTLRSWLEDSWLRPPAGILVPLRPNALKRALEVWKDLTSAEPLRMTDIVIVGFDSNGVNWRSRHSLQASGSGGERTVLDAISKLILKYQGVRSDSASDGTMRALASAAKLVPYDSALFIITDKEAGDPQKLPLALRALIEKRLKVYTIWTDPRHPSAESELALQELRNVSAHTEGDVLSYSLQAPELDNGLPLEAELQQWEPLAEPLLGPRKARLRQIEDSFDTLLLWRGGGEAISLGIPVESGVTALRILIEGAVDHAALFPPNEAPQVDLYNKTSVQQFSSSSRTDTLIPRDVFLGFPGAPEHDVLSVVPVTPMNTDVWSGFVGVWHISVRCDSCDYRLTVYARSQVHFQAEADYDALSLRVFGAVASVRESSLVDEYGTELAKLPFSSPPINNEAPDDYASSMTEIEEEVPLPKVKGSKIYAKILGRNTQGDPFVRIAGPIDQELEVRNGRSAVVFPESANDLERTEEDNSIIYSNRLRYNDSNALPYARSSSQVVNQQGVLLTSLLIGLSSRLYGSPGDSLQLHFEVTNHRDRAVRFNFGAQGELRFLRSIEPLSQTIPSGQTVNVIVNLMITASAQPGARDLITFTAYGLDQISTSTYVYVLGSGDSQIDTWAPEIRHHFQGHCIGRTGNDCADHVWSTTIFARDATGGILRITSSPTGLTAAQDSRFISGTREETISIYRATCCNPRVLVNAVDIYGNTNSYAVDISGYITDAGIAAIVLGILLFIALVSLIIFLITRCVRKGRSSKQLPYATSSRSLS